jgi:hypothetical protein
MSLARVGSRPWLPRRTPLRWAASALLLAAALAAVPVALATNAGARDAALERAVGSAQFGLVRWEQRQLLERGGRVLGALFVAPRPGDSAAALAAYVGATGNAARAVARPAAEAAVEAEIGRAAAADGLALQLPFREPLLFPPVSTWIGPPPQVLIVSPRDRIEVQRSVLLDPDLDGGSAASIEAAADATGVSSLVVPIGGLSTYPSMVLDTTSPQTLLTTAAHEWAHGYLFFRPLGQAYFADYDARAINETVAESFGRELGERIARQLGVHPPPPPAVRPTAPGVDFNRHMRETRRQVDALLAQGRIAEAESYMEQRRQELLGAGFQVRKLNQAYFAFYGSYTESPAASSTSPIPDQVRRLRQQSGSLGEFLRRAATIRNAADLARLVG